MKYLSQRGVTLIEMMVAIALMGALAVITYSFSDMMRKETTAVTEDLTMMIERFGASKIITRDMAGAEGSFNYIELADDNNMPFFVLARNEQCNNPNCSRTLTLSIPPGQTKSRYFYLITKRPQGREITKFSLAPESVFDGSSNVYSGINHRYPDPDYSLHKRPEFPDSPWDKGRLLLLSSEIEFYDCFAKTQSMGNGSGCNLTCSPTGSCNYVAKRPYRLLGVVNNDFKDLTYFPLEDDPSILKTNYRICRPNSANGCASTIQFPAGIVTTKTFFDKLPYMPGGDNRASLAPVEVVRYHLERPGTNSPDHTIRFHRATASLVGSQLKFQNSRVLMTGLKSLIFTRANISSPLIEYKMVKVRTRKSVR